MSIKHKIAGLGLAVALAVGGSSAALAAAAYVETPLNVRADASVNSPVIDVLRRGERVNVEFCEGTWCAISDPRGWVSARYLTRDYDDDYYDDDDYFDDPIYIERPRRIYPHHRHFIDRGFEACVGGRNARFCVYD